MYMYVYMYMRCIFKKKKNCIFVVCDRYEMAIGTTIDGNQVMDFTEVVPDPVTHAVHINSLNLYGLTKVRI